MGNAAFDVVDIFRVSVCCPVDMGMMEGGGGEEVSVHSQFALLGSYSARVSILRRPWDVARIAFGSTSSSFAILHTRYIYINLS